MVRSRIAALGAVLATVLGACAAPLTLSAGPEPGVPGSPPSRPPSSAAPTAAVCEMSPPSDAPNEPPPADTPGTAPTPAQAQVFADVTAQVEKVRGLAGASVPIQMLAPDQVNPTIDRFRTEHDKESAAGLDPLAKQLGWVPEDSTLEAESKALQSGLVLGFYVPQAKKLWVVQRGEQLSPLQQATVAHEWTHALQDANYDLVKIDEAVPRYDFDQSSAITAVEEGDASHTEEEWSQQFQTPEQRQERAKEEASVDVSGVKLGPLVADLLMPYQYGPAFVSAVMPTSGTPPLTNVWRDMPTTTTEILHPDLYKDGFNRAEIGVEDYGARLGEGWEKKIAGTWGEYSTANAVAGIAGLPTAQAELPYVKGWLGDCLGFWRKDSGRFGAITTKWADADTAAKFGARVDAVLERVGAEPAANGFRAVDPQHLWKVEVVGDTTTLLFTNDAEATAAAGGSSRV